MHGDILRIEQITEKNVGLNGAAAVCVGACRKCFWLAVACVATLGVLLVSHIPQETAVQLQTGFGDKLPHAVAYGVLALCWLKVFNCGCGGGRSKRRMLCGILVPIVIGTATELTQAKVGRCCDPMDLLANAVGVGIAAALWVVLLSRRRTVVSDQ